MRRQLFGWVAIGIIVFLGLSSAAAMAAPVTVYYFHSTARCEDCLKIEQMAGEILRQAFSHELAEGVLTWRPLNADLPENTHFVFDFNLAVNELVVARGRVPHERSWDKLPEVWRLVHDPEQLRADLVRLVRQALSTTD